MDMGTQGSTTTMGGTSLVTGHSYAVLRVQDYDRAKKYYQDMLGLKVMDAPNMPGMGTVSLADGTGFELYVNPALPAPQNTTLAILVKDFDMSFNELKGRGVMFEEYDLPDMGIKTVNGVAEMQGIKSAWFKDSEGNIINLLTDYISMGMQMGGGTTGM
ncbi:MAG TPA: VOC family protein [Coriobacteriia bacterium]|jgi:predicted enzyme related to lactoylglutathione lyase